MKASETVAPKEGGLDALRADSGASPEHEAGASAELERERYRMMVSQRNRLLWQKAIATVMLRSSRAERLSLRRSLERSEKELECSEKDKERLAEQLQERDSLVKKLKQERESLGKAGLSTSQRRASLELKRRRSSLSRIAEAPGESGSWSVASLQGDGVYHMTSTTSESADMVFSASMDSQESGKYSVVSMPTAASPDVLELKLNEQSAQLAELRLYSRELEGHLVGTGAKQEELASLQALKGELSALRKLVVELEGRQPSMALVPAKSWWQNLCLTHRDVSRAAPAAIDLAGASPG